MERQILYYYQRGVASYLIAKKIGISNTKVRSILKKSGVRIRSHDVTNKISASKRTPEENRKITQKATEANIGSTHSNLHRVRLALARQRNPRIDSVYEKPLLDFLKKRGIETIPQKAFYRFNVDLYLVKENVVIEIFGGGFHNKKVAVEMFNNKMKYLSSKKVPVVIVWADKLNYNPEAIMDVAINTTSTLTVINGDGTPTTRGLGDIILNN